MSPTVATIPLLYVVSYFSLIFTQKCSTIYTFFTLKYHLHDKNTEFFPARLARSDFRNKLLYFSRSRQLKHLKLNF